MSIRKIIATISIISLFAISLFIYASMNQSSKSVSKILGVDKTGNELIASVVPTPPPPPKV